MSDENKIVEMLGALHKRFDNHEKEHAKEFALNDYKLNKVCGLVDKHNDMLYGNGKPGLLTDVAKIKSVLNWVLGIAGSVMAAIIIAHFVKRG